MSRKVIVAEMEGTYPYLSQEDAGGTECDLSREDTTGILREIQNLDESASDVDTVRSRLFGCLDFEATVEAGGNCEMVRCKGCEEKSEP